MLSGWESLTPPGWDTIPSQVSSQQTLVLIYLPRKDRKLSWLRQKRRLHKYSNLRKARNWTGDLVVGRQRSTNCANHACLYNEITMEKLLKLKESIQTFRSKYEYEISSTYTLFKAKSLLRGRDFMQKSSSRHRVCWKKHTHLKSYIRTRTWI